MKYLFIILSLFLSFACTSQRSSGLEILKQDTIYTTIGKIVDKKVTVTKVKEEDGKIISIAEVYDLTRLQREYDEIEKDTMGINYELDYIETERQNLTIRQKELQQKLRELRRRWKDIKALEKKL